MKRQFSMATTGGARAFALLILAGLMVFSGCGRDSAICKDDLMKIDSLEGDVEAVIAEADSHWAKRGDEAELRKAIELYEKAVRIDKKRSELYTRLARAWYFLGDGHLRFDEDKSDDMLAAFERGTIYAELGMREVSPEFKKRICDGEDFEESISVVEADAVPMMYWYATNLGKWALAKSLIEALNQKNKIAGMMERCRELNANYFYGGPDRYFGAYYTKIPFPGGDKELSRKHFDTSIEQEPNYFATRVLMADMLATKADDRELFEKSLKYVLDAPVDVIPELSPEQAIEKKKAKKLMDDIDIYFEPADS